MKKLIIIANKPGQLGNLLAVYAHFLALAVEGRYMIFNPAFHEYNRLFEGTRNNRWARKPMFFFAFYMARSVHRLRLNSSLIQTVYLDWNKSLDLDTFEFEARITLIQGWLFRGDKVIRKNQDRIRKYFTPAYPYLKAIKRFSTQLGCKEKIMVGVHIRQGDYQIFENGKYLFSLEQYRNLMESVVNMFGQEIFFLICSNVSIDEEKMIGLSYQKGPGSAIEDLYTLARCQYLIGPPSTFTGWASFYGKVPLYHVSNINAPVTLSNFKVVDIP